MEEQVKVELEMREGEGGEKKEEETNKRKHGGGGI